MVLGGGKRYHNPGSCSQRSLIPSSRFQITAHTHFSRLLALSIRGGVVDVLQYLAHYGALCLLQSGSSVLVWDYGYASFEILFEGFDHTLGNTCTKWMIKILTDPP